jgi:hypothetical protein
MTAAKRLGRPKLSSRWSGAKRLTASLDIPIEDRDHEDTAECCTPTYDVQASTQRLAQSLPRVALGIGPRSVALFWHGQQQETRESPEAYPANQQRQRQLCGGERDVERNPHETPDLTELRGAHIHGRRLDVADFISQPRLMCPADTRTPDAQEHAPKRYAPERGHGPYESDTGIDYVQTNDHRQAAAVHISDHASRDLRQEDRGLHDGTDQHKFKVP